MGRWGGRSLKPITLPRPKHRPAQDDDDAIYRMVAVAGLQKMVSANLARYWHFWPNICIFGQKSNCDDDNATEFDHDEFSDNDNGDDDDSDNNDDVQQADIPLPHLLLCSRRS